MIPARAHRMLNSHSLRAATAPGAGVDRAHGRWVGPPWPFFFSICIGPGPQRRLSFTTNHHDDGRNNRRLAGIGDFYRKH